MVTSLCDNGDCDTKPWQQVRCGKRSHCINVVGQLGDQTLCGWTVGKCHVTDGERSVSFPGLLSVCLREWGSYIEAEQGREEKPSHSGDCKFREGRGHIYPLLCISKFLARCSTKIGAQ